jgi:hypothetical protein
MNIMADEAVVHIGQNSAEYIAYRLLSDIYRTDARRTKA